MDELSEADARNYSFPELVEITGYLMLYRISGFKSLSQLFPNLAVIRGRELFKAYSLIVYECETLEDIGLVNLQTIERGHVRIEKNIQLCFADRVDWSLIAGPGEHHIEVGQLKSIRKLHSSLIVYRITNCLTSAPFAVEIVRKLKAVRGSSVGIKLAVK